MKAINKSIAETYRLLYDHYEPQGWWPLIGRRSEAGFDEEGYHPGLSPELSDNDRFEIAAGAVLTQNTSWNNVRTALNRLLCFLHEEGRELHPEDLLDMNYRVLAQCIRPSGYYNQKAKKLKVLSDFFITGKKNPAREELLSLWGIGPETADSILLYAFDVPVFVIDAYTVRIFSRMSGEKSDSGTFSYERLQMICENSLRRDTELYREYHALLVAHGKRTCSLRNPECPTCPLRDCCTFFLSNDIIA